MARAQNSYMAGSTSPSSFIQTACFLGIVISLALEVEESAFVESIVTSSAAKVNDTRMAKIKSNFVKNFISSMYKDLFYNEQIFVKKVTFLQKMA